MKSNFSGSDFSLLGEMKRALPVSMGAHVPRVGVSDSPCRKAGVFLYTVGDHLMRVTHDDRREWLGDQESNLGSQIQNLLSCP